MNEMLAKGVSSAVYYSGLWDPYFRLKSDVRYGSAVVVNFHRITDASMSYLDKGLTVHTPVQIFESLIKSISRHYDMISMGNLVDHLTNGDPFSGNCAVVTFDDGYEDNSRLALPVLKKYNAPATVFIATDFIENQKQLWMDRLEQALLNTKKTKMNLAYIEDSDQDRYLSLETYHDRCHANVQISKYLKSLSADRLDETLSSLESILKVKKDAKPQTMMTWDQVRELASTGVEIGSHGMRHIIMTQLESARAEKELLASKQIIENKLQKEVQHFAFPNGGEGDFNQTLRKFSQKIGYQSVSSCVTGLNRPGREDRYNINRVGLTGSLPLSLMRIERMFRKDAKSE